MLARAMAGSGRSEESPRLTEGPRSSRRLDGGSVIIVDRSTPRYLRPYARAVAEHGRGFDSLLWSSRKAQERRFEVLLEVLGADRLHGARILDLGSGHGDLAVFLAARGVEVGEGIGIEAIDETRQEAVRRALRGWRFVGGDFVAAPELIASLSPDWTICSGSLNSLPPRLARRLVRRAFEASRRGVAFNALSSRGVVPAGGPATRFDPASLLRLALRLTPRVTLRHHELGGADATFLLERMLDAG